MGPFLLPPPNPTLPRAREAYSSPVAVVLSALLLLLVVLVVDLFRRWFGRVDMVVVLCNLNLNNLSKIKNKTKKKTYMRLETRLHLEPRRRRCCCRC